MIILIPANVAADFFPPEFFIGLWPFKVFTIMLMPEAPVNKNDSSSARENYVWLSRKVFSVKPVSVSVRPQQLPNKSLRFSVLALYSGHIEAASFR